MYGRVNCLFGGTGRWKERELQMKQRELEPIKDTIRVEAFVEKMKNRAIHSVSGGLYIMATGLLFGQASSMMQLSGRWRLAYQSFAMALYFIAGLFFIRAGAAAYDSRLPVLEKRIQFLKSEIERLQQRLPPPTPLQPPTD
jgi:hypothetical protein